MRKAQRGFTVIELAIVAALVALLATVAVAIFTDVAAGARIAKAQADVRSLATGVYAYATQAGVLPSSLEELTAVTTDAGGRPLGPFIVMPGAPRGWTPYR